MIDGVLTGGYIWLEAFVYKASLMKRFGIVDPAPRIIFSDNDGSRAGKMDVRQGWRRSHPSSTGFLREVASGKWGAPGSTQYDVPDFGNHRREDFEQAAWFYEQLYTIFSCFAFSTEIVFSRENERCVFILASLLRLTTHN